MAAVSGLAPAPASPLQKERSLLDLARFPLFPGLLANLRLPGPAPPPAPPTTTFTTQTITEVATLTTPITEEIVITFLNRPITTHYVRTTTMVNPYNCNLDSFGPNLPCPLVQVVTDIHVTRSPVIIS